MATETGIERLRSELHSAINNGRTDQDRIEILTAALCAFRRPVSDYEPRFKNGQDFSLGAH